MCKLRLNVNAKVENGCKDDVAYEKFLGSFQSNFDEVFNSINVQKLFITNAEGLWDAFINNIDANYRQHYNCNCCRRFIDTFGGLVFIDEDGNQIPALWSLDVPELFHASVKAVLDIVRLATVTGVFFTNKRVLGTPKTAEWTHYCVELPNSMTNISPIYRPYELIASSKEDFKSLMNGLMEFSPECVDTAVQILKSEALTRPEKFLGFAQWLQKLHKVRKETKSNRNKTNITWLAVATAPAGFCHVKSSIIGTLLEDIADGQDFNTVKAKFDSKVDPMKYMRSQSDPSEANKQRAEKIFETMGLGKSLERRFARLDEVKTFWKPKEEEKQEAPAKGLFGHVKTKESNNKTKLPELTLPPITMTWDKFNRTVLPEADSIEMWVPITSRFFSGILTAEHADAKPIIRWDSEDNRNPFSHYLYQSASSSDKWNLKMGWVKVTGVCYQPSMWQEGFGHQGKAVFFLLDGCKDTNYKYGYGFGNGLFPEMLISELHEVRKTVEAYSSTAPIEGYDDASACGIRLQSGNDWNVEVRVASKGQVRKYKLDRWD